MHDRLLMTCQCQSDKICKILSRKIELSQEYTERIQEIRMQSWILKYVTTNKRSYKIWMPNQLNFDNETTSFSFNHSLLW